MRRLLDLNQFDILAASPLSRQAFLPGCLTGPATHSRNPLRSYRMTSSLALAKVSCHPQRPVSLRYLPLPSLLPVVFAFCPGGG